MAKLSEIRSNNASLKSSRSGLTAVVVGGTNGIGRGFLAKLASQTDNPKVYIVGRSAETLSTIISELKTSNGTGTYIPIQAGDLSLLAEVEKATTQILNKESKIDLLFMSQGFMSLGGRNETPEGIDKITSIRHYARTLFILNLLPLLNKAPAPRVITVVAGGLEGPIFPSDLEFKDPKNYSVAKVAGATSTYITLTLEQLQARNPKISFIHAFPGLVKTNLFNTEHLGFAIKFLVNWIVIPTVGRFLWSSPEDSGERFLYLASSPHFGAQDAGADLVLGSDGKKGSGIYTVSDKLEAVHNDAVLSSLRQDGSDGRIWNHTTGVLERVLQRKV